MYLLVRVRNFHYYIAFTTILLLLIEMLTGIIIIYELIKYHFIALLINIHTVQ